MKIQHSALQYSFLLWGALTLVSFASDSDQSRDDLRKVVSAAPSTQPVHLQEEQDFGSSGSSISIQTANQDKTEITHEDVKQKREQRFNRFDQMENKREKARFEAYEGNPDRF